MSLLFYKLLSCRWLFWFTIFSPMTIFSGCLGVVGFEPLNLVSRAECSTNCAPATQLTHCFFSFGYFLCVPRVNWIWTLELRIKSWMFYQLRSCHSVDSLFFSFGYFLFVPRGNWIWTLELRIKRHLFYQMCYHHRLCWLILFLFLLFYAGASKFWIWTLKLRIKSWSTKCTTALAVLTHSFLYFNYFHLVPAVAGFETSI